MQGEVKERWTTLREQAAAEQDTQKLMVLIQEINRLLEQKVQRVHRRRESCNENATVIPEQGQ